MFRRILMDAKSGDGGGSGNDGTPPPAPKTDLSRRLRDHKGNAAALAGELHAENRHLQERIVALSKRLPPEGAVILQGEDVATWNAYQVLGTPQDIQDGLEERETLRANVSRFERERLVGAHGYKATALGPLLPADARLTEVDGTKDPKSGNVPKVLMIAVGDETSKPVTLAEYIDTNLSEFKPVLGGPEITSTPSPTPTRSAPPSPTPTQRAPAPGEERTTDDPVASARRELAGTGLYSF